MPTDNHINEALADAVMDRPREFFINGKRYCLWTPSLGMTMMIGRHLSSLGIDYDRLNISSSVEALRLVLEHRDKVAYILAILSFRSFVKLSNSHILQQRADLYMSELTDEELAQMLLIVLNEPTAESLIKLSGIDEDRQEQSRIISYKNKDGHTVSFGCKTIFGTLIDIACRTYGWSKQYVVWGIDLTSLKLMIADASNSIYLSDEDMKALNLGSSKSTEKFGMTREDIDRLKAMDWS